MIYRLKRHPFEIEAFLRRSLVLTYSVPKELLEPLLKPGLTLDTFKDQGFFVAAMVQAESLRLRGLPRVFGKSFFLAGYRLFVRYRTKGGKNLRGLQILRSQTNSPFMRAAGSLTSHYRYELVQPEVMTNDSILSVRLRRRGETILDVTADVASAELPVGSIFASEQEARRFEGPMPFTFDHEPETDSILRVQGVRGEWHPRLVQAQVLVPPPFEEFGVEVNAPRLASCFLVEHVPYRWKKGVLEKR